MKLAAPDRPFPLAVDVRSPTPWPPPGGPPPPWADAAFVVAGLVGLATMFYMLARAILDALQP